MLLLPAWGTESGKPMAGAAKFAARFAGSPLGCFSLDRLFFTAGAGSVASQCVVKLPVSWLYNNGVLWRWDMYCPVCAQHK